jgi:soluble lytic murein transglycosylase-like protein
MMDLTGVRHVQARIAQLQEQFGMPGNIPGMGFSQKLEKEMQKSMGAAPAAQAEEVAQASAADKVQAISAVQQTENAKKISSKVLDDMPLADQNLSTLIEAAARKYKVDPKLVAAVAEVESNGNQNAVSSAGAIGVMQLMPDTAASLGVDPYNKQQNVEGGAKYLRQMLDTFGGDTKKAVAAYNAGPGAVKDYGGVPPYKETQNYVKSILANYL